MKLVREKIARATAAVTAEDEVLGAVAAVTAEVGAAAVTESSIPRSKSDGWDLQDFADLSIISSIIKLPETIARNKNQKHSNQSSPFSTLFPITTGSFNATMLERSARKRDS
jgi:hypothetical protein